MQIANTQVVNDSTISFEVYIKSYDSNFQLTSYQCALSIDNRISVTGFSYIEGTSQLKGIIPNVGLGYNDLEGETKLTFASLPGNTIISTYKLRVGKFLIKTKAEQNNQIPVLQWCFDGKISTILTTSNFDNITNAESHSIEGMNKISIKKVTASSTTDSATGPEKTIDGKGANDGDDNSRWAAEPMPAYLIFDLGSTQSVAETKFSFYEWNNSRIYHYSISTSADLNSWEQIVVDDSSSSEEWTVNSINKYTRFIKLTFLSNNQCDWAGLWEAQIYSTSDVTAANVNDVQAVPKQYTLSQNYPNPFNPTTKINFTLAEAGKVALEVYNILGEKVSTLVNQDMSPGSHEIKFNASNLASGIYIYRINMNNKFTDTRKMILMK